MTGLVAATLLATVLASLVALICVVAFGQRTLTRERDEWARRVLEAQEAERAALARELHDSVVPALGGLALKANSFDPGLGGEMSRLAREVREISHGLYPSVLDHGGLSAALQDLVDEWPHDKPHLRLGAVVCGDEEAHFTDEQANAAYRIAQAALANAVQHAAAEEVVLTLRCEGGSAILTVTDNGRGWQPRKSGSGLGWRTMQERAGALGGHLDATRAPGGGTTITLRFPMGAM